MRSIGAKVDKIKEDINVHKKLDDCSGCAYTDVIFATLESNRKIDEIRHGWYQKIVKVGGWTATGLFTVFIGIVGAGLTILTLTISQTNKTIDLTNKSIESTNKEVKDLTGAINKNVELSVRVQEIQKAHIADYNETTERIFSEIRKLTTYQEINTANDNVVRDKIGLRTLPTHVVDYPNIDDFER